MHAPDPTPLSPMHAAAQPLGAQAPPQTPHVLVEMLEGLVDALGEHTVQECDDDPQQPQLASQLQALLSTVPPHIPGQPHVFAHIAEPMAWASLRLANELAAPRHDASSETWFLACRMLGDCIPVPS